MRLFGYLTLCIASLRREMECEFIFCFLFSVLAAFVSGLASVLFSYEFKPLRFLKTVV
jgi:hypothetical protein